jgi:dCTP deaminase
VETPVILTGKEIESEYELGRITIEPFDPKKLQPNSYDVTLGWEFLELKPGSVLDMRKPCEDLFNVVEIPRGDEDGYLLEPGGFYLGYTNEAIGSDFYVPYIDGKSSVGRLGISIHETAGRGDLGFKNRWTLEITVAAPVRVYPGYPIGQVTFHTVVGERELYSGKYSARATGPVASQYWRNFR